MQNEFRGSVKCIECGADIEFIGYPDGGDWVPYGSTYTRLPEGYIFEFIGLNEDNSCPICNHLYDNPDESPLFDQAERQIPIEDY